MKETTIFTELLIALDIPHSSDYSNRRFDTMTFKSLFGLTKLLSDYGIDSEGVVATDKETALAAMPVPVLARIDGTFVVVTAIGSSVDFVNSEGTRQSLPRDSFLNEWTGETLVPYPRPGASEPDYRLHRDIEFLSRAKVWVLAAVSMFIFLWLFIANGIYSHVSTLLLTVIDIAGLFVTYLLLLKQLGIKSDTAESVCGVIQAGGCNTVLSSSASKFFGLFGWSEVGFAYFGVSLATLLIFPQYTTYLAAINVCCLPFSFWSVWYQHFRAHAWCTLCLIVQSLLWLSFFCYLGGGWFNGLFPIRIQFFILGASYVVALLGLNRLLAGMQYYRNAKIEETE